MPNVMVYASPRTLNAAHAFSCSVGSLSVMAMASASASASTSASGGGVDVDVGGMRDFAGESALITLP